jgi:hypothetical protein
MLLQGVERWSAGAVHDTVAVLIQDRGYHRSFWSSILGRALVELERFILWMVKALQGIPGGRTTVLVIVAAIVVLIVARLIILSRSDEDVGIRPLGTRGRASRIDPWSEAQALAAAGDYLGASHALYQAVLRRLAETERIRLHPSRTSGDYVRELRRRGSPLATSFQAFGRRFDRVVFGRGECSADEFAAMLRDASAIPDRQAAA